MSSLAVFNSAAFLNAAQLAVAANATVEVRREIDGVLAAIYSNRTGVTPITNPSAFADSSGRFTFYAAAVDQGYSVMVTSGSYTFTLHNVALGTSQYVDYATITDLITASAFKRNAIIGGDFSTNPWQRGTSFSAIAAGAYSADRWTYDKNGLMVHTVSKSTDAPTVAQAGRLTNHCLLIDCTTIDASIGASEYCVLQQMVEGYNFIPLAQGVMAFQFWHKHTKAGTYCVAFSNSGFDRSYVAEYTQAVSDTWEISTVIISASPTAGTWDYTNGIGIRVYFTLAAGSNFQTTANAWNSGGFLATANQVNACDNVANNFRIALVQLERGGTVTPFQGRTEQEELSLCERYYEKSQAIATVPGGFAQETDGQTFFTDHTAAFFRSHVPFKTRKRGAVTFTTWDASGTSGKISYFFAAWTQNGVLVGAGSSDSGVLVSHSIAGSILTEFAWAASSEL